MTASQQHAAADITATADVIELDGALALIGLDWGTSSLRAYAIASDGTVIARRALPYGIMHLPSADTQHAAYEQAFTLACGDWLKACPQLPVLAAGMIGSAQGWVVAPYVDAPADVARLAASLTPQRTASGKTLHIVPGVIARGTLPNVMRGEETQIVGVTAANGDSQWIGLPGTHAKWAKVRHGYIEQFATFMTGELFSVLVKHTILGRTMREAVPDDVNGRDASEAFLRGVDVARLNGAAGVLSTIFTTRTLGLTDALPAERQADYLSGLLIGHELRGLSALLDEPLEQLAPILIGDAALCTRYETALARFGCTPLSSTVDAAAAGLWRIASAAGLLSQASLASHVTDQASSHAPPSPCASEPTP